MQNINLKMENYQKGFWTLSKQIYRFWVFILAVSTMLSCAKESDIEPVYLQGSNVMEMESELIDIVNAHRLEIGKIPLLFNDVAYRYANEHTSYMISKNELSHDNFENRASKIALAVDPEFVGENVAKGYTTAQEAFTRWYASPDHRKSIDGEYTHTAVSIKKDSAGNLFYTQMFYR